MRNLMILFPGIGYHCDKPILYYGKKIAVMNGYTDCISLSYSYDVEEGIAFIGMKDPWSDVDEVIHASRKQRIPIYVYEDVNHSLETGQVIQDLDILKDVMIKTNNYLSVEKH